MSNEVSGLGLGAQGPERRAGGISHQLRAMAGGVRRGEAYAFLEGLVSRAMVFLPLSVLLLFPAMLLLLEAGRRLRNRKPLAEKNGLIESAVFSLFGLLLAFTFSGAIARYDAHRALLTEETNAIGTAYLRLDLLPTEAQPPLRALFREYTESRLHLYDPRGAEISPDTVRLQSEIWKTSVRATASSAPASGSTILLLPADNSMIDVTSRRQNAFNMHPPGFVLLLLVVFSCGSAFLAGYGTKLRDRDWVYPIALALAVTLTVYATTEIEYPRLGLLRFTHLDRGLIALRDSMK